MARARISTTVDAERLAEARRRLRRTDSELIDQALLLLLRELDAQRVREAFDAAPHEDDPDLAWEAPPGPSLPYDGDVPPEVLRLARERRARYEQS